MPSHRTLFRPCRGQSTGMTEITGVLLAAGFGSRFGAGKLQCEIDDRPLIAHSAAALAPCDRIVAVVPTHDIALQALLLSLGVDCVLNPEPARGLGYSIACAIRATPPSPAHRGWCLLPADMPWLKATTTQRLVDALRRDAVLAAPYYCGRRGHPVAFSARFRDALGALDGDTGARIVLQRHADQLTAIATDDAGVLADVDTIADLESQRPVS